MDPLDGTCFLSLVQQMGTLVKEWAGVAAFLGILLVVICGTVWCLCQLRRQQIHSQAVVQGLALMQKHEAPAAEVWPSILDRH